MCQKFSGIWGGQLECGFERTEETSFDREGDGEDDVWSDLKIPKKKNI